MTARDIIAGELQNIIDPQTDGWVSPTREGQADDILTALSAAGCFIAEPGDRIVKAGELDRETLERAAEVAANEHSAETGWQMPPAVSSIARAIRALRESGG